MQKKKERRKFPRYSAVNLMADIDGQMFAVTDISLGGLRLAGDIGETFEDGESRRTLTFSLRLMADDQTGEAQAVRANGLVVGRYDDATAIKFQSATMPLMKIVVRHASLELGVEPYFLK